MIEWRDEGLLLAARPHGESAAIVEVLTPSRGRHAGVVHGGASRRIAPTLQPGTQVQIVWKARLEDHLGTFTIEPVRSRAAVAMADRLALAGLGAVCALLTVTLAEREAHAPLYTRTVQLLDLLGNRDLWPLAYLRWEQALLAELGYALDLSTCAATGATEGLVYVSPRSGRAVSAAGAGEWADRMLPLPPVLAGQGEAGASDVVAGLEVTGYFIEHRLIRGQDGAGLPAARARLLAAIGREGG